MSGVEEGFLAVSLEEATPAEPTAQENETPTDYHYTRDDWYKLLSQDGYLKVLKHFALSGELQRSNMRSICWKLFLGCLPEDQCQWIASSKFSRDKYAALKQKHMVDPHEDVEASLDLNIHNPLSLEEDSPWNQYFQDGELKQTIVQDIVRTHPDQMFFRQQNIQNSMLDILFCYAKEEPNIGYRQGMHELLAPILFVLHAESRDNVQNDESLSPELKVVMDPQCIDADAYSLFAELMEGMQQFFLSSSFESEVIKARERKNSSRHSRQPFESDELYLPSSAIAKKLDKIHDVLLKRADEQLYYRLKDLGIPPQTYGIRWIRLLFGREFHLPSVLQLWDALFVEGPSLGLMDYIFVTMLTLIRDTLLTDDYSTCMQLLMKYPTWYEVSDLVQRALHLRSPSVYPNPVSHVREWTQINEDYRLFPNQLHIQEERSTEVIKKSQKFANKTKSVFAQATRQMHIPTKQLVFNTKLSMSKHGGGGGGEAKPKSNGTPLSASVSSSHTKLQGEQEMIRNPKSRPRATSDTERLKEQIEINEAKCLYCGRKMESILEELQLQVEEMKLTEENETPLYLAIAGLKQVRDLLLHKLPFSGELPDYDELTTPPPSNDVEHVPFHLLAHKNEEEKEEVEHTQEQDKLEDNVLSINDITESN